MGKTSRIALGTLLAVLAITTVTSSATGSPRNPSLVQQTNNTTTTTIATPCVSGQETTRWISLEMISNSTAQNLSANITRYDNLTRDEQHLMDTAIRYDCLVSQDLYNLDDGYPSVIRRNGSYYLVQVGIADSGTTISTSPSDTSTEPSPTITPTTTASSSAISQTTSTTSQGFSMVTLLITLISVVVLRRR